MPAKLESVVYRRYNGGWLKIWKICDETVQISGWCKTWNEVRKQKRVK